MYQLFNIDFLRPSFHSSKKVAVSPAHCNEKDDLPRTYRNRDRESFGKDEDEESFDSTEQCGDSCLALIQKHQQLDAIEVINSANSVAKELRRTQRVRFIDEMLSSHIVTDTHYRPVTTEEEKSMLYYCSEDYDRFALEDWCWRVSNEIKMIQNLEERDQEEEPLKKEEDTRRISRVRRHHDLVRANALVVV